MNAIPSGVEAALLESGFSSTEVLIIRRLLIDDMLTLRGLASATGKGTGVLDQAAKKLLQKNIIRKETLNGSDKYTITSMDAVLHWMEDDSQRKRELLTRRQQTFESFVRSFEHQKHRPAIEYFEGIDGLAKAYRKLLECKHEILGYVPVFCSIEDHPLRDFMVEWFRQRRYRGVFSRIITHNTPLGRRFHSRDPFEYRQSLLVEEDLLPFTFEKIICGDIIVCFNFTEKRACMLTYPELASMERAMFESWWRRLSQKDDPEAKKEDAEKEPAVAPAPKSIDFPPPVVTPVPLSIRTLSGLREFFLSRASIAAFCGIAVLSAAITLGLYHYTKNLQFEQMKETVKSIAATGAFQFEAQDLDALQKEEDWKKPEWAKVVKQLEKIRTNNDDITFVYLFRKTKNDPTKMEFIADSHSLNPFANTDEDSKNDIDANRDGIIDPEGPDKLQWPGQAYPEPDIAIFQAYEKPSVTEYMIEDSFGKVVSGFAAIKDANGRVVAVIGVDMKDTLLLQRTTDVFQPILYFLGFFLLFVLIRLMAFNRSLFVELWKALNMRKALVTALLCAEIAFLLTFVLYQYMLRQTIDDIGSRTMAIVATAASQFDPKDLEQLHWARDMKTDAYQRVFEKLNGMRKANTNAKIEYAYIFRHSSEEDDRVLEFVADADSNYYLSSLGPDLNSDGILDQADENVSPGVIYYAQKNSEMLEGFKKATFEKDFYIDKWGKLLSAYAPIQQGSETIAILGADVDASAVIDALHKKFAIGMWFFGIFSIILFLRFIQSSVGNNKK